MVILGNVTAEAQEALFTDRLIFNRNGFSIDTKC